MMQQIGRLILFCVVLCLPVLDAGSAEDAGAAYREVLEDYLVARHCGLDTEEVKAGFRIAILEFHAQQLVSASSARALRAGAGEDFRQHWQTRGLEPDDAQCRTEGRTASERLLSVLFTNGK